MKGMTGGEASGSFGLRGAGHARGTSMWLHRKAGVQRQGLKGRRTQGTRAIATFAKSPQGRRHIRRNICKDDLGHPTRSAWKSACYRFVQSGAPFAVALAGPEQMILRSGGQTFPEELQASSWELRRPTVSRGVVAPRSRAAGNCGVRTGRGREVPRVCRRRGHRDRGKLGGALGTECPEGGSTGGPHPSRPENARGGNAGPSRKQTRN